MSAYEQNPFDVPEAERHGRMRELIDRLLAAGAVSHTAADLSFVQENKYFANLAGTTTTQQRVRILPHFTAIHVDDDGFSTMRTLAAPAGRGWEYLTGTGWDFDTEIAELPDLLADHVAAPSVEAGRYDLVVDPTNLWLTIHESIAHATELDRALGYEAAYAGTSFATVDQLGTLQYGSDGMYRDRRPDHRARPVDRRLGRRGGRATGVRDHLRRHPGRLSAGSADVARCVDWTVRTAALSPTRPGTSRCSGCRTCRCDPTRPARASRS